jgi:hypothetical protein
MSHEGRAGVALATIVSMIALSGGRALAQANAQATNSLPNTYQVVENYFKLPEGRKIGSTAAVDIGRDGRSIWIFERCGGASGGTPCAGSSLAPILEFESSGKLVKSFGAGMFVYPHGIHVDREGNIWVTDGQGKDGKGQQVFKFSPDGKVLMTLGKAGVAGDGPEMFNQPSHVFVAPSGDIFVADGHGGNSNARVVKFSKDGKFIKTWGKKGSGPGEFDAPTRSPWIRAAGCSSPTAGTAGFRSSIRTADFSQSGSSSAGRAACTSTETIPSMRPTRSPMRKRIPATAAASGSGVPEMAR